MITDSPGPLDGSADDPSRVAGPGDAAEPDDALEEGTSAAGSPEADEAMAADAASGLVDAEIRHRLWLRALVPLLQLRSQEPDPNDRVQFALDRMYVAACERVARILRSDLPPDRA
jgi:hypothetical protein